MIFTDVPAGESVFVDANVFVYHFVPDPNLGPPCRDLLERIKRREIQGFTSADVVNDVAYRVLTLEAMNRFGRPAAGIGRWVRQHPLQVQTLTDFRQAVDAIPQFGIQVLPITQGLVAAAAVITQQTGLLSNDALILAVMQAHGLTCLASHDADFDRVPSLTRYAPV